MVDKRRFGRVDVLARLIVILLCCWAGDCLAGDVSSLPALSVPIRYDRSKPFDSPRVMLNVSGRDVEFLFDTGTSPTMIFHSFVAAHRDELGTRGESAGTQRNLPLHGSLAGATIAAWTEIPDTPFEDFRNMGGLFSPQSITEGVKVIDFRDDRFLVFRNTTTRDVVQRLQDEHGMRFESAYWHGTGIPPVPPLLLSGSIGPFGPRRLDLDTGSSRSRYAFSPAKSGIAVREGPREADIFGNVRRQQETVNPLPVRLNGASIGEVPIIVTSAGRILDLAYHGTIGMDILRNCILVLPEAKERRIFWSCRTTPGPKPPLPPPASRSGSPGRP